MAAPAINANRTEVALVPKEVGAFVRVSNARTVWPRAKITVASDAMGPTGARCDALARGACELVHTAGVA
jgi:hypothetical protein